MAKRRRLFGLSACLAAPFLMLMTATCTNDSISGSDCGSQVSGVDSDGDGLSDDVECKLGTDANKADTDGDGLSDGIEFNYPKICVATDRAAQRRPPPACTTAADCAAGETCNGLDPTRSDSDGDGVLDNVEDPNFDGTINFSTGETDPRLWDTDGNGASDADSGAAICRPDGLAMVVRKAAGPIQVGHDPVYGMATTVQSTAAGKYAAVLNDATSGIAALLVSQPSAFPAGTVTDDRIAIEAALKAALIASGATVTDVFIGRQFSTHEKNPAITSTFRVVKAASDSAVLRDAVVKTLSGGTAPGGVVAGSGGTFYLDVTTVRRATLTDSVVVFSPTASYDNPALPTAIRVSDLINASAVAEAGKDLDYQCQGVLTGNSGMADIIWTVDISLSMDNNQVRLAQTAQTFFQRLRASGLDFRVGVFNAFSTMPMLSTTTYAGFPQGFKFVSGSDASGDLQLCRLVTSPGSGANGYCPLDMPKTNDMAAPFGPPVSTNANEEAVSAAVLVNDTFNTNSTGTNPDWKWRPGATKVAFMVTDEAGSNDFNRYFKTANMPGTATPWAPGGTYSGTVLNNIVSHFKAQNILPFGAIVVSTNKCSANNVADLPRCVIETAGGAYVDIATATDTDIQAAMNRLVDAIAGAASQFILTRTPITSTIKVAVGGRLVPRSRLDGFDYDTVSRSIVFYGNTYRPKQGDQVFISYRVWVGSLG